MNTVGEPDEGKPHVGSMRGSWRGPRTQGAATCARLGNRTEPRAGLKGWLRPAAYSTLRQAPDWRPEPLQLLVRLCIAVDRQDVTKVSIRHGQVRMTELPLDHIHRDALRRELCRVAMPKRVRVDPPSRCRPSQPAARAASGRRTDRPPPSRLDRAPPPASGLPSHAEPGWCQLANQHRPASAPRLADPEAAAVHDDQERPVPNPRRRPV